MARASSRDDRLMHLDSLVQLADVAASKGDHKKIYKLARDMVKYNPPAVKSVRKTDGSITAAAA